MDVKQIADKSLDVGVILSLMLSMCMVVFIGYCIIFEPPMNHVLVTVIFYGMWLFITWGLHYYLVWRYSEEQ